MIKKTLKPQFVELAQDWDYICNYLKECSKITKMIITPEDTIKYYVLHNAEKLTLLGTIPMNTKEQVTELCNRCGVRYNEKQITVIKKHVMREEDAK